ncbi:protein disulfide-isomerase precursor [Nowakowskiella sp. JEL0078]|nr:protein disulfide-isomerase precursor [Nowakowskiella sp. JEL0078]
MRFSTKFNASFLALFLLAAFAFAADYTQFDDLDKLKQFVKADRLVIVGFFDSEKSEQYTVLKEVADSVPEGFAKEFFFSYTFDKQSIAHYNVSTPTILVFTPSYPHVERYTGKFEIGEITLFIRTCTLPLYDDYDMSNYAKYLNRDLPMAYYIYSTAEEKEQHKEFFIKEAIKHRGVVSFVSMNGTKFDKFAENNFHQINFPSFAILKGSKRYPYVGELSPKLISSFVEDVLNGSAKSIVRSEPESISKKDEDGILVLVGKNFEKVTTDVNYDVFVNICAPSIPHCKEFDLVWAKLAEYMKQSQRFIFAKMDGTRNDIPESSTFELDSIPTLVLYKAESSEVIRYTEKDKSLKNLWIFLKKNSAFGDQDMFDLDESESTDESSESTSEVVEAETETADSKTTESHDEL